MFCLWDLNPEGQVVLLEGCWSWGSLVPNLPEPSYPIPEATQYLLYIFPSMGARVLTNARMALDNKLSTAGSQRNMNYLGLILSQAGKDCGILNHSLRWEVSPGAVCWQNSSLNHHPWCQQAGGPTEGKSPGTRNLWRRPSKRDWDSPKYHLLDTKRQIPKVFPQRAEPFCDHKTVSYFLSPFIMLTFPHCTLDDRDLNLALGEGDRVS